MAHLVIPGDMSLGEKQMICAAIRTFLPPPSEVEPKVEPREHPEKLDSRVPTDAWKCELRQEADRIWRLKTHPIGGG